MLEAAHIIPYVNAASNLVVNGLCLRADIHKLYDRNLITIGADYLVYVSARLRGTAYAALHGRNLRVPLVAKDRPDTHLLSVRHRYIKGYATGRGMPETEALRLGASGRQASPPIKDRRGYFESGRGDPGDGPLAGAKARKRVRRAG